MDHKKETVRIVRIISKLHGELWDRMEEWLRMYVSEISFEVKKSDSGFYQATIMLDGEGMLTLRKASKDPDNVKRYAEQYIEHIKNSHT